MTARLAAVVFLAGCGSASLGIERDAGASPPPDGLAADLAPVIPDASGADVGSAPDGAADVSRIPDLLNGASFALTWTIQWFGSPTPVSCAEAGTPVVIVRMTDASDRTSEDRFPCAPMMGQTRQLPSGPYLFYISIEDEAGRELGYAKRDLDLPSGRSTELDVQGFELQSFQLGWTLQRAGKPTTCAAAGARSVELVSTIDTEPPITYSFPCTDGQGITKGIRQGHYLVAMRLIGVDGKPLVQNPAVPVEAGDERRATVPPVVFALP